MSVQDGTQVTVLQHPPNDDKDAWKAYWQAQGQLWRAETEIRPERQHELAKRLASIPDEREEERLYFQDIQLNRADIEWLLATQKKSDKVVIFTIGNEQLQRYESLTLSGADYHSSNILARFCQ